MVVSVVAQPLPPSFPRAVSFRRVPSTTTTMMMVAVVVVVLLVVLVVVAAVAVLLLVVVVVMMLVVITMTRWTRGGLAWMDPVAVADCRVGLLQVDPHRCHQNGDSALGTSRVPGSTPSTPRALNEMLAATPLPRHQDHDENDDDDDDTVFVAAQRDRSDGTARVCPFRLLGDVSSEIPRAERDLARSSRH